MIIGLAGHVDHGKSALVTALTGAATDRHPEERHRGITIDLQAVALRDAAGRVAAALVDVPGHEDFLRAMVAGASGIAAVLLVIAADEGVMPQTREHLLVLERLGVTRGIPVLTKVDLIDPELADLAAEEVRDLLADSPIAFEAPHQVSVRTGQGVDALRSHLLTLAASHHPMGADDHFRLPVDKSFSRAGVGTILTGTTWSGSVAVGDHLRLLPRGSEVRVRTLEVHGASLDRSGPGTRLAVGVAGLDRDLVHRGDVLVHADVPWPLTAACDVTIVLSPSASRPLDGRRRVRVHLGTAELPGRLMPRGAILPGATGLARLVLDRPVVVRGGDRFVLRSWSPATTIGGGQVLDPAPPLRAPWPPGLTSPDPALRLAALVGRRRHGVLPAALPLLLGVRPAELPEVVGPSGLLEVGGRLVSAEVVEAAEGQVLAELDAFHRASPREPGRSVETLRRGVPGTEAWADAIVARLAAAGRVVLRDGLARRKGFRPAVDLVERAMPRVLAALREAGLQAPRAEDLGRTLGEPEAAAALRMAEGRGRRWRWSGGGGSVPRPSTASEACSRSSAQLGRSNWRRCGRGPDSPENS